MFTLLLLGLAAEKVHIAMYNADAVINGVTTVRSDVMNRTRHAKKELSAKSRAARSPVEGEPSWNDTFASVLMMTLKYSAISLSGIY